jgi:dTDP-4-amino-4,6-dideoxygalactose transaminase
VNSLLAILGGRPVRSDPWPRWPQASPSTVASVMDVLESSRWTVSGPYDGRVCYERRFAAAFADFHGVGHCTPTTSGTAALTIALQAVGIGRGDEVLVPGLTWVACASAVLNIGAVPILVDIDPDTLAMSADHARAAVTDRTAAVVLVHPYCAVADLDAFTAMCDELGLALVEDCAQAHGARWRDRPVGTFGAAGCFSMQQAKLLTSGEGGAVITDDPELYARTEQLRCDGRMFSGEPELGRLELTEVGVVQGRNFCMSEFHAAILLSGLAVLAQQNERRAECARQLESALAGCAGVEPLPADRRVTARTYYNFVLRFDLDHFAGNTIDAVATALAAELDTMVNPMYVPLNDNRLLCPGTMPRGDMSDEDVARRDPARFRLPNAARARETCLTLTHPVLLDDKKGVDDIVAAIEKVRQQAAELHRLPPQPDGRSF